MAFDLTHPLVIGISSRALFDLESENHIYETQGLQAYISYQRDHENEVLPKGPAFALVEAFLKLNRLEKDRRTVEVIIMSRNSADTSLRIFRSIKHYGLDITRAALVGGAEVTPYLKAFRADLFLSAHAPDVKQAVDDGIIAAVAAEGLDMQIFDCIVVVIVNMDSLEIRTHGYDLFILIYSLQMSMSYIPADTKQRMIHTAAQLIDILTIEEVGKEGITMVIIHILAMHLIDLEFTIGHLTDLTSITICTEDIIHAKSKIETPLNTNVFWGVLLYHH